MFRWRLYSLLLLLIHNLLLLLVSHSASCLSTTPDDRIVVVNSSTVFECSSNRSVIWSFRRTGQFAHIRINTSGPRYSLNSSTDDWYGLVISEVQLSDSGVYTCIDNDGFGPPASAYRLVVLDSLSTCDANVSASQPVIESQIIELRCSFIYAGDRPPQVSWTSPTVGMLNSSIMSTGETDGDLLVERLESWIVVVAAAGGIGPYRYSITSLDDDDDDTSESTTTPMFIWNSSSYVVLFAVRNVVINMSADDEDIVVGDTLHCHADGFPPARYEWRNDGTGRTFIGPDLQLDADGQHTYTCIAKNVVSDVTYSARAQISLLVTRPSTTMKSADSVVRAVVIATTITAIIAALVVCCVILVRRLIVVSRRAPRSNKRVTLSPSSDSAVIIRQQVRVSPPQNAAAVFRHAESNTRKPDAASCLYDVIDEQSVGYEELPRLSTVEQCVANSPGALERRLSFSCCNAVDGRDATCRSPCRTPAGNDYLLVCGESDGQAECCLQEESYVSIRHAESQQPSQHHGLYVNDRLQSVPARSEAELNDVGVYLHTLSDD